MLRITVDNGHQIRTAIAIDVRFAPPEIDVWQRAGRPEAAVAVTGHEPHRRAVVLTDDEIEVCVAGEFAGGDDPHAAKGDRERRPRPK